MHERTPPSLLFLSSSLHVVTRWGDTVQVVLENMKLYDFKDVPTGIKAHIRTTLAERRMAKDAHRRGHFYVSSTSSSSASASASSFRTPKLKEVVRVNGTWVHPQPPPPAMFTPWPGPVP